MATKKKQSKLRKFIGIFNPTTRKGYIVLFVLIFAIVGGGYMLYRSFALTAIASYTQGPKTSGVKHTIGSLQINIYDFSDPSLSQGWIVQPDEVNGHFMWYGPYHSVNIPRAIKACWRYVSINSSGATNSAYIDLVATDSNGIRRTFYGANLLLTTDNIIKWAYPPLKTHLYCTPILSVTTGNYHNLEIRMKPLTLRNTLTNRSEQISLVRTNYQIYR